MSDYPTLKKEYGKLKKKYPLPKFEEFTLVFGFPKEDELKSVLTLFQAVKKTPFNVAHWIMNTLSPCDNITANDNKILSGFRDELLSAMKKCVIADKQLSLVSFKASRSKDPEKLMVEALSKAVADLKDVATFLETALERTVDGWSNSEDAKESTYHG